MIQQQTFALDTDARKELIALSALIVKHKDDPARTRELIAEHDLIMRGRQRKDYDPVEEAKWA